MTRGWANCWCEKLNQPKNRTAECWVTKKSSMRCTLTMFGLIPRPNIWIISKCSRHSNYEMWRNTIIFDNSNKSKILFLLCSKKTTALIHSKRDEISNDLIGSWTVHVGDMDQCLHLWRITGGFEKIDTAHRVLENDTVNQMHPMNIKPVHRFCLAHINFNPILDYVHLRIINCSRRSVEICCVLVICNTCYNSATGRRSRCGIHRTSTRCGRIAWNPAQWSNGETTGPEASTIVKPMMCHSLDFSRKSDDCITFITFGVGFSLFQINRRAFYKLVRSAIW